MGDPPLEAGPETFRVLAERLRTILKCELDVDLAYDGAAVEFLDGYIGRIQEHVKAPEGLIDLIGSFVGECLIAAYGGAWVGDEKGWGVRFDSGFTAFPFNKVAKRFQPDGEYDSIASFYRVIPVLMKRERNEGKKP